ncbi:MAG TPA: hypothetical protein VK797_30215 [Tepidisphaeraceae bacterium]|jgi:anti-sigma factor RsiW|nr:hypothetical protein [Tepidisphaeraceae bacterium]
MMGTFENDEQLLLLYLADELPAADRAELEQRLTQDPRLAARLDRLASLQCEIEEGLGQLDKLSRGTIRPEVVGRQVGREIRQRLARPKLQISQRPTERQHRMLPWLIPTGVAASLIVGTIAWVHHRAMVNEQMAVVTGPPATPHVTSTIPADSEVTVELLEQSFQTPDDAVARADTTDELSGYLLNLEAAH